MYRPKLCSMSLTSDDSLFPFMCSCLCLDSKFINFITKFRHLAVCKNRDHFKRTTNKNSLDVYFTISGKTENFFKNEPYFGRNVCQNEHYI